MIILRLETTIRAPVERCFDLARSVDLHAASASIIHGEAVGGCKTGLAEPGDCTTWSARFFGLRFSLATKITAYSRPHHFSDELQKGLFTRFGHHYAFRSDDALQTVMTDEFFFQSPFGFVGALFDQVVLRRKMGMVADFRIRYIKRVAESGEWKKYLPDHTANPACDTASPI